MPSYKIFFYTSVLFLLGVFFKSIGLSKGILIISFALSLVLFSYLIYKRQYKLLPAALLPVFILLGAFYYSWDHINLEKTFIDPGNIESKGVVVSNPKLDEGIQEFHVKVGESKILVETRKYPEVEYGDVVLIEGKTEQVKGDSAYGGFLHKNHIVGTIDFPDRLEVVDKNKANKIKYFLYKIRNESELVFQKLLSPLRAALVNGLTLGGYSGFGEEFRGSMEKSGTTHLVALSGYNISVLVWVCMAFFMYFFRKRTSIIITLLIIAGFVTMTGAEGSVVRAAIMGSLIVLAAYFGRFYDLRNALVLSALLMTLFNPKVLTFDIGFQLSFMALIGIVYIKPLLDRLLGFEGSGFMAWKENLTVTTSAQIAVFPLLMINFNYFSLSSLMANVFILEFIPITMALGFILLFVYLFSYPISLILSWVLGIFLAFEVEVIRIFGSLNIPLEFSMSWSWALVYYLILFCLTYLGFKKLSYV